MLSRVYGLDNEKTFQQRKPRFALIDINHLNIPSNSVERIQECHLLIGHSLIEDIENNL